MALLNYTTEVPVARSVAQVHGLLVEAGAHQVTTTYGEGGSIDALTFAVQTAYGLRSYVLPVNAAAVENALRNDRKVPPRYKSAAQAERVSWRILKDWIEAQLAIIRVDLATLEQVMLPYMVVQPDGTTVYDLFVLRQLALPAGGS